MPEGGNSSIRSVIKLHKKHIKGTPKGAVVKEVSLFICNLTRAVTKGCSIPTFKVYITSRSLKHLYDKRVAYEYDTLLRNLVNIIKYPEHVYYNLSGKRGSYSFVKEIGGTLFFVSLELITNDSDLSELNTELWVATAFKTDEAYLKKFTLLWSWRGGIPSS